MQLTLSKNPKAIIKMLLDEERDDESGPSAGENINLIHNGMINWIDIKAISQPLIKSAAVNAARLLRDIGGLK